MKITRSAIIKAVFSLLETGARQATVYLNRNTVVTVTRRHKPDKWNRITEVLLRLGAPNYLEQRFIKDCRKAGERFPVRKVQLRFYKR